MLEQVRVAGVERGQRQSKAQFFSCVNVIDKAVIARGYWQREDIVGFHMTSLKFKLQNYRSY